MKWDASGRQLEGYRDPGELEGFPGKVVCVNLER